MKCDIQLSRIARSSGDIRARHTWTRR